MHYLNQFIFGIYPYIAASIFFLGSLIRFDTNQYSWKSESSQLLYPRLLRMGNILFHIGILGLFFGHLIGLLTPVSVWDTIGVSHTVKQLTAMIAGGVMGTFALIGLLMLIYRRFSCTRLFINTSWRDKLVLIWLLLTLCLGLGTIHVSAQHRDGSEMISLMQWAQHIITFRSGAADIIEYVNPLFKLHLFMGMSIFVMFPFTRLVHIWSGFGTLWYLKRKTQLVRSKRY